MRLKNKKCQWCGMIVKPYGSGRQVVFCNDDCRKNHLYEKRGDLRWKVRQGYADKLFNQLIH